MIHSAIVSPEILIQRQRCIGCTDVNSHGDPNAKEAEKVDQNHLMQGLRGEELDRRKDTRRMTWHRQRNTVRGVHDSETCVIGQTCCFAGQRWFKTLRGISRQVGSEYWSCRNDQ
uniref:Uncharacterized protein n=1 Tax=Romanomermis culicivorax TaxID=13658 RepID=A0A915HWX5_ROMCU